MRGLIRTWLRITALFALLPVLLMLCAFGLPAQYTDTFLGGYADKVAAMQSAKGPRILLAGGSGAAFAVRSDLLEAEFPGYRVINLGMYAGLGSTVPLSAIAQEVRAGDIVIFLPEQSRQTLSTYWNSEAMWQAADGHFSLLDTVPSDQLGCMLGQLPYFAAKKLSYFLQGIRPQGDGIYARDAFGPAGDIISPLRDLCTMPEGYDANTAIDFSDTLPTAELIARVNAFSALCKGRGATFYFAFCPMNAAAPRLGDADAYESRLAQALNAPLLGHARDSLMPSGWFFDTNFHLNSAGAEVYTAQLALDLKAALGMPETIAFSLPAMPADAPVPDVLGDDADADCFVYRPVPGGWQIAALTEAGQRRAVLTLPTHAQGLPVLGIDAAVFAGDEALTRVTVQPNITALPDGAFDGCTRLEAVVMQGVSPAGCTVGQGLLQGTEATVLVDADLLPAYQTNYFWAVHAPRIKAMGKAAVQSAPETIRGDTSGIVYDGNGGSRIDGQGSSITAGISQTHLRTNTLQGTQVFTRPGYIQLGWNTRVDGTGDFIPSGSRIAATPGMVLYAVWVAESPAEDFLYASADDGVMITGYKGTQQACVIPAEIHGKPVVRLQENALHSDTLETLVLPPTLRILAPGCIACPALRTLYLFDTMESIADSSFAGCDSLNTLYIIAATPPRYAISYYAAFADKYDRLQALAAQRKLVLFSGSSTRYAYESATLHRAYPDYDVVNMGVYAYTNALPQLMLIRQCMGAGDVLLHAPEFDCLNFQFCETNQLDFHFFAMMEANYAALSRLALGEYTAVFDSLQRFLTIRAGLPGRSYEESPNGYDDDGNCMNTPTYNAYGDFIMPRANNKVDIMLKFVRSEYTPAPFTDERIAAMNAVYQRFLDEDIQVLFTYTPRNRSSISEDSTPENRKALHRLLKDKLIVPIISSMEKSLMSGIYFFVIDSHLSNEGARLFTQQIIEDLKPWLAEAR